MGVSRDPSLGFTDPAPATSVFYATSPHPSFLGNTKEHHNMDFSQARAMFKNKLNRSWGQHIARGWASLLLDRLRDYFIPSTSSGTARSAYSDHYGPDSGEVNDQLNRGG